MKKHYASIIFFVLTFACGINSQNEAYGQTCDTVKSCIGNALTLTVNSGKGAHYVDVDNYSVRDKSHTALTFEAWIKPERIAGTTQYIAGLWGPGNDNNDVWVVYFAPNDDLVFEINGDGTKLRSTDNTIVRTPATTLFSNKWSHIAAVFDGASQTAYLYINAALAATARNAQYPSGYLRPLEKNDLPLQIGSCNALSNDAKLNRTFRGQIDEIRIWQRALSATELLCQKDRSLNGNEANLQIYYRCNSIPTNFTLCDATGKGYTGRMRSGAVCAPSDRPINTSLIASPANITANINCDTSAVYTVTIQDTSICANSVAFRIVGRDNAAFTLSQTGAALSPKTPVAFQVRFNSVITGSIIADLKINTTNRCDQEVTIPIRLTRKTEFTSNRARLNFDTLYAGCREQLYKDTVISICNTSGDIGQPRPLTITGFPTQKPGIFQVITPTPITIDPGDCRNITVRFISGDTSALYFDTLSIVSNSRCAGGASIPLRGVVREVLGLTDLSGKNRLNKLTFPPECVGQLSNPVYWTYRDLTSRPIQVDTVIVPPGFTMRTFRFPAVLQPNTGYLQEYFRFFPNRSGQFNDSIIFICRIAGSNCTVERKVYVTGRGIESKVQWSSNSGSAGTVIVGQERTFNVTATNPSPDTLRVSFYLESGEVFLLAGAKAVVLAPGKSVTIPITFRPLKDSLYIDKLCLFEQRCFTVDCIPIDGRGIIETFRYDPYIMRTENVTACGSRLDTMEIENIVNTPQTMTEIRLSDPSGRFTVVEPMPIPSGVTVPVGRRVRFIFRYTPNDITQDRADKAYLKYKCNGVDWAAPMFGSSAAPRLSVTTLTQFGTLEVGDKKIDSFSVENSSQLPIRVDSISIPPGFTMLGASRILPAVLSPRDSIIVRVQFEPAAAQTYDADFTVYSDSICPIKQDGRLGGKGIIIKLDAPLSLMNWGYVRPCDCIERELPLVNQSLAHNMTVDSLWVDSVRVTGATPQFWSWKSSYSPSGTFPFTIPPNSRDTVRVTFCPRTPAEDKYVNCAARLHINAAGMGWSEAYEVLLVGKRALLQRPTPTVIGFPPTRVDTALAPYYVKIIVPWVDVNPEQEPIVIDSITFEPDERVFSYADSASRPFPLTVTSIDSAKIRLLFKPRSPRLYVARMRLHISKPCPDIDTTVLVTGSGFAPPFSLDLTFDNVRPDIDTFRITTCDTLRVPIYTTRSVPADLVTINCRIGYDTNELQLAGLESPYLADICYPQFLPSLNFAPYSNTAGSKIIAKNLCSVDSLKPFVIAKLISKTKQRSNTKITVDSINFDTERTILFKIISENDEGRVIVQKTDIQVMSSINFDSVRVLDCVDRSVSVLNTGDVPVTIDSLPGLAPDVQIIGSVPARNALINPGDSIVYTLRFCPRKEIVKSDSLVAKSVVPCAVADTNYMAGQGYAPDIPVIFGTSPSFPPADTARAVIGDTVTIPIFMNVDLSAQYHGTTYWLEKIGFDAEVYYDPFALKLLSTEVPIQRDAVINARPGHIKFTFTDRDTVRAGKIAEMKFLAVAPDSAYSAFSVTAGNFRTDSLMFIDIVPLSVPAVFASTGECTITTLRFTGTRPSLMQNRPNPFDENAIIDFMIMETAPVTLVIYDLHGRPVKTLLDGSSSFESGTYSVNVSAADLETGVYTCIMKSGTYTGQMRMSVVK
ncbi:hypothetical protein MASR2M18_08270 [Ignavibacteria bacterium]|nr:choice-of-anchor D domain-containing protein [Bacteroidota bacterium]MCZ2133706.1 choice-of-anchor D domain-containing protein [Bacteroidota bacterium]